MLRLKPNALLNLGRRAENVHVLAMRAQRSYPAVSDYTSGRAKRPDLDVLGSILVEGLGLTPEQVLNLRLGDLFEFRDDPEEERHENGET